MRILFIEDDAQISALAKVVFLKTSHDVIICPCPDAATKLLSIEAFNIIILDMTFPVGSGDDVLSYMVKHGIKTPVIVHSGYTAIYSSIIDHYEKLGIIKAVYQKPDLIASDMLETINLLSE